MTRFSVSRVIVEAQEQARLETLAREIFDQAYSDLRKEAPTGNAYMVLYVDKEDGSSARNGCDSPIPVVPRTYGGNQLLAIWAAAAIIGALIGCVIIWIGVI